MAAEEMVRAYPDPGLLMRMASVDDELALEPGERDDPAIRARLRSYLRENDLRGFGELMNALFSQKIMRATTAENQLHEVLTDFWLNHFHVSLRDTQARPWILAYERDAVRPHVTGSFRDLLGATAKHPAMLLYLDNAQLTADPDRSSTLDRRRTTSRGGLRDRRGFGGRGAAGRARAGRSDPPARPGRRSRGLNENYARELLELHTLGVDGGYTQEDVVEVARAFTGWSVVPPVLPDGMAADPRARAVLAGQGSGLGFVREGSFLFRADAHDAESKRVLDRKLPAGRGIEDGEEVLDLLAGHPATARHLATKLAVHFVSDDPPASLIDRLAATFSASGGDLEAVIRALAYSPELWVSRGEKIKTPFELTVSAVRAVDATIESPAALVDWLGRMGQTPYGAAAPTGYADQAEAWVGAGGLVARMNFALELAAGALPGIGVDLPALLGHREPESEAAALVAWGAVVLPARDLATTVERLLPLLSDPAISDRLAERSPEPVPTFAGTDDPEQRALARVFPEYRLARWRRPAHDLSSEAQVVGLLLGSPEFQRR
jgi:uncharacterized protein (DUF1800 family)